MSPMAFMSPARRDSAAGAPVSERVSFIRWVNRRAACRSSSTTLPVFEYRSSEKPYFRRADFDTWKL